MSKTRTAIATSKSQALSAAAADATNKADKAKSDAVAAAATDATVKVNAAKTALDTKISQTQADISVLSESYGQFKSGTTDSLNSLDSRMTDTEQYADEQNTRITDHDAEISKLKEAVWPLEVSLAVTPTVVKAGVASRITVTYAVKRDGKDVSAASTMKLNGTVVTGQTKGVDITAAQATVGTKPQTLEATYSGMTKSKTVNVSVVNPSFHGVVAAGWTPTESAVKALTELLQTGRGCTRQGLSLSNQKIAYAYPKSYGALTSVKDGNNFEVLGSYTRSEMTVGLTTYYVYVLTDPVTATGVKQTYA